MVAMATSIVCCRRLEAEVSRGLSALTIDAEDKTMQYKMTHVKQHRPIIYRKENNFYIVPSKIV